jgi:S1-C subfamily serine protease
MAALPSQFADDPQFPRAMQTKALTATVRLYHSASKGEGSGVVVKYARGIAYILTAAHVVPAVPHGDEVTITFFPKTDARDAPPNDVKGTIKERMVNEDLAVIEVALKEAPPSVAPLCPRDVAPPKTLTAPQPVLAVGIGTLGAPEANVDRVRAHKLIKKPDDSEAFHWEADQVQPIGKSGGPLLDKEGRVIGICTGTMNKKGYYLSIYEILSRLRSKGYEFLSK